jgi:hypothetical protein
MALGEIIFGTLLAPVLVLWGWWSFLRRSRPILAGRSPPRSYRWGLISESVSSKGHEGLAATAGLILGQVVHSRPACTTVPARSVIGAVERLREAQGSDDAYKWC